MNFIQKHYLDRQINNFVEKRRKEQTHIYTLKEANSICFFITFDTVDRLEELIKSVSVYNGKKVVIICYCPSNKIPENMNMDDNVSFLYFILRKDISLTGRISEQIQKNVFSQHYDVFVDVDTNSDLISLYLKTFPDADFRIGRNGECATYFDFTFSVDQHYTIKDYISNLEVYLSKLKGN